MANSHFTIVIVARNGNNFLTRLRYTHPYILEFLGQDQQGTV